MKLVKESWRYFQSAVTPHNQAHEFSASFVFANVKKINKRLLAGPFNVEKEIFTRGSLFVSVWNFHLLTNFLELHMRLSQLLCHLIERLRWWMAGKFTDTTSGIFSAACVMLFRGRGEGSFLSIWRFFLNFLLKRQNILLINIRSMVMLMKSTY